MAIGEGVPRPPCLGYFVAFAFGLFGRTDTCGIPSGLHEIFASSPADFAQFRICADFVAFRFLKSSDLGSTFIAVIRTALPVGRPFRAFTNAGSTCDFLPRATDTMSASSIISKSITDPAFLPFGIWCRVGLPDNNYRRKVTRDTQANFNIFF